MKVKQRTTLFKWDRIRGKNKSQTKHNQWNPNEWML